MKLLIRMTNAIFNIDKKTKYSCSKIKFSILKIKLTEVWLSKVEYQKQENQHCTQSKVHTYSEQCYKYLYMWVCE